ncbi:hypothetical protein [Desulfopila aestuarii]|uniref:DUF5666 domain-containing protein n=1 Tax=Desulfopila aestuarii DSM 18488 TaxID=1121416 RepID=A0A1M7YB81_9BACT|nr:hypothetical protein [Desulfopila aestuarii]SHO49904.1 hypothetical protein SAMN02745220_03145 [Desulfopila aestuarii DSM 18488]
MSNYRKLLLALFVTASLTACSTPEPQSKLNVEKSAIMSSYATVEAVDMKTRMVTLKDPEGQTFTIHAGEEVVNLPQVHPGDRVDVTYAETLSVRMAEPGETKNEITGFIGRAEPGEKPAAVDVTETSVSATIEAIDKVNETATLKMPDGSYRIVKAEDPTNLDKVKVGDTIVIVYQEAVGIFVKGMNK